MLNRERLILTRGDRRNGAARSDRPRRDGFLPGRPARGGSRTRISRPCAAKSPVAREGHHGVTMVTGWRRGGRGLQRRRHVLLVHLGHRPVPGLPCSARGRRRHRVDRASTATSCPSATSCPALDPPVHTDHRALLMRLITPKRLKENEDAMWQIADRMLDDFLAPGEGDFVNGFAGPFTLLRHRRSARRPRGGPRRTSSSGCRHGTARRRTRQHRQKTLEAVPAGVPLRAVRDATSKTAGAIPVTTY